MIAPAAGADVAFSKLYLYSVKHLSFTGVDFLGRPGESKPFVVAKSVDVAIHDATFDGHTANGYGAGHGLWLSKTNGFTLADSRVHDFATGLWIAGTSNLIVSGNALSNISQDAMIVGGVHKAVFAENTISLHVPPMTKHTDGMQFYNSGSNNPLRDVVIRDNQIATHNGASHGIYMANGLANSTGNASTFFRDIVIKHNTVVSG